MAYDFSISGSTLVVTLDTESGKFAESITVYSQPNLVLGNDRIFLKEEGLFLQEFVFDNIGDINGDTATNLISAYELLDSLIKSIFVTTAPVDSRIYKVYTALLSQSGTDAPVATVLENTIGTITWLRDGVGSYYASSAALFTASKTYTNVTKKENSSSFTIYINDTSSVYVEQKQQLSSTYIDDMNDVPVEIRVYN